MSHYRLGITEHEGRNAMIASLANAHCERRDRVLITTKQIKHTKQLEKLLKGLGLQPVVVIGKTPQKKRAAMIQQVQRREGGPLLGTVFGEGVDMPWLDVVIIADGMSSPILAMQRLRNLTPYDPLTDRAPKEPILPAPLVLVYDFADDCTPVLASHSRERLATYGEHEEFEISGINDLEQYLKEL